MKKIFALYWMMDNSLHLMPDETSQWQKGDTFCLLLPVWIKTVTGVFKETDTWQLQPDGQVWGRVLQTNQCTAIQARSTAVVSFKVLCFYSLFTRSQKRLKQSYWTTVYCILAVQNKSKLLKCRKELSKCSNSRII